MADRRLSRHDQVSEYTSQASEQAGTQCKGVAVIFSPALLHKTACFSQPDAKGHRDSSGAQAALLSAAVGASSRPPRRFIGDEQRADALRPVHLVAGEAERINVPGSDVHIKHRHRLCGVDVEEPAAASHDRRKLSNWLERAYLIVHRHDRNDSNVFVDTVFQRLWQDDAPAGRLHLNYSKAVFLRRICGLENGFMLEGADYYCSSAIRCRRRRA